MDPIQDRASAIRRAAKSYAPWWMQLRMMAEPRFERLTHSGRTIVVLLTALFGATMAGFLAGWTLKARHASREARRSR